MILRLAETLPLGRWNGHLDQLSIITVAARIPPAERHGELLSRRVFVITFAQTRHRAAIHRGNLNL